MASGAGAGAGDEVGDGDGAGAGVGAGAGAGGAGGTAGVGDAAAAVVPRLCSNNVTSVFAILQVNQPRAHWYGRHAHTYPCFRERVKARSSASLALFASNTAARRARSESAMLDGNNGFDFVHKKHFKLLIISNEMSPKATPPFEHISRSHCHAYVNHEQQQQVHARW